MRLAGDKPNQEFGPTENVIPHDVWDDDKNTDANDIQNEVASADGVKSQTTSAAVVMADDGEKNVSALIPTPWLLVNTN